MKKLFEAEILSVKQQIHELKLSSDNPGELAMQKDYLHKTLSELKYELTKINKNE